MHGEGVELVDLFVHGAVALAGTIGLGDALADWREQVRFALRVVRYWLKRLVGAAGGARRYRHRREAGYAAVVVASCDVVFLLLCFVGDGSGMLSCQVRLI